MSNVEVTCFVVYISPAGTTRHVAGVIENRLDAAGCSVVACDLGQHHDCSDILDRIAATNGKCCLFIGTPVYAFHAVPPVMKFIEKLPASGGYAVPFAVWGGVTSGIALHEMGERLTSGGCKVPGAGLVLAEHSLTWQFESPLCSGHPGPEDDAAVARLVDSVVSSLASDAPRELPLSDLLNQPEEMLPVMQQMTVAVAGTKLPPRTINQDVCTQCGVCMEQCPTGAMRLDTWPVYDDNCIYCYKCLRVCPEQAIEADFSMMEAFFKEKLAGAKETAETRIFIPTGADS